MMITLTNPTKNEQQIFCAMSSTIEADTTIKNVITELESLQIDSPLCRSPSSSLDSNDASICSLEIVQSFQTIQACQLQCDELPIFSISSLSPSGSLSPVEENRMCISPVDFPDFDEECSEDLSRDSERVSLNDINALIGTPDEKNNRQMLNLETIFEDVFLETPPKRQRSTPQQYERTRFSFDSISRYVTNQQKFDFCNGNYNFDSLSSDCVKSQIPDP
ncbi:hypothetical protein Bhyg_15998 [Pseudolycoriella hygida]|uniref:Uncharacterized protein n=1 Tax=Pseudolycoriella hygida TaxID=35572 RepID=A0A9Q0MLM4_9DIPT|nr:hypothetical protein Bhyg_15998 [Pseudolycoriella hygida]